MEIAAREYLISIFLICGVVMTLLSAIGLVRMPDLYMRMSTTTKGATLGIACIMIGSALYFGDLGSVSRAIAVVIFMMLTAPVAAHMLGRAAFHAGVAFWSKTEQVEP